MPDNNKNNEELYSGTVTEVIKFPNPNYPWLAMVKLDEGQSIGSYVKAVNGLYFDLEVGTKVQVAYNWKTFVIRSAEAVKQNPTVEKAVPRHGNSRNKKEGSE